MQVWKSLPSITEGGGLLMVSTFWPHLRLSISVDRLFLLGDELLDESDIPEGSLLFLSFVGTSGV